MEKINLTLYTVIGKPERIPASVADRFLGVTKSISTENERTTLILQDDSRIIFNLSHEKDRPDFITSHIQGMTNYFAQAECASETLKQNVLRQIGCFNCVTGIVFETDENNDRTNYIINTLFDIASDINGFLLYPSMSIYNGKRQLVFSIKGKSELEEFRPTANADLLDAGRPEDSEADTARRERSIALLKEQGIPFMERLRNEVTEQEASIRSREEMLQRATALFAVAVYSEVLLSETPSREEGLKYVDKIDEIYGIRAWLTPAETDYLTKEKPEESECIQFLWRYECCAVLLWAAGIVEELPYPSEICDVPVIATLFWQHKGTDDLLSKGIPRTDNEILDAADITLHYDWACVDARIKGQEAPATLDGGIVMERHYTFNWITGANHNAQWDDIQPNT